MSNDEIGLSEVSVVIFIPNSQRFVEPVHEVKSEINLFQRKHTYMCFN